jgi:hypothetical protein
MLSALKKLATSEITLTRGKPGKKTAAPEYIFLLDIDKKKEYLLDLRTILRTPGARRALPQLHKLETTVTRNEQRIRIPHEVMPELVRELVSVDRRIPAQSPLREVMQAVPGLAKSITVDPTPTSVLMGAHEGNPGELNTREMNAAARQVGQALAGPTPKPAQAAPESAPPGVLVMDTLNPSTPTFGNSVLNPLEQQRFLEDSKEQMESTVLRTSELADTDMAAYFDLCIMSGEYDKVIDALLARVTEEPSAWAWTRLLAAAEAAKKMELEMWVSTFRAWVSRDHPALLPDMLAEQSEQLRYGVRRSALHELEKQELSRKKKLI